MSDILKGLWGKLYAWALPSALAVGFYWIVVYPKTKIGHAWLDPASDTEKLAIFSVLTAAMAFSLNAFSTPLYRVLEGYLLWPRWLQTIGVKRQKARKSALEEAAGGEGWRQGLALEELALYPKREAQIAPTRFGNALRSFETYGKTRYNLDSQTLWYELYAVCPKNILGEMGDARSAVDFFVASFYLSLVLGLWTAVLAVLACSPELLPFAFLAVAVGILCHWLAVRATGEWGYTVQALVNVGRAKLAESLGLQIPPTLDGEKEMWGLVTAYSYYADQENGERLDVFRKKPGPAGPCSQDDDPPADDPDPQAGDDDDKDG